MQLINHLHRIVWLLTIPTIVFMVVLAVAPAGVVTQPARQQRSTAGLCHQQANDRIKQLESAVILHQNSKGREDLDQEKRFQSLENSVVQITKTIEGASYWLRLLLGAVALSLLDKAMSLFGWAWAKYNGGGRKRHG